ncbi:ATP-binding protein [Streptomyces sp. NPDC020742]|uniref:ATP-binding protein n=1 Tax=unclassified Streptomyces TaxID=2593676 RepID=UPI0033FD6CAB
MTQAAEIPATAAEARNRVHDLLQAHPQPLDEVFLIDALLITSELVTNARRHAGGVTAFAARITDDRLEILVEDAVPQHPVAVPHNGPGEVGGYGWPMVCQLATSVDITPTDAGKAIAVAVHLR